jgi:hypothetical protein
MKWFGQKSAEDEYGESSPEEKNLLGQLDELQRSTEEIEAEKEAKRFAREERKFLKEAEKKRKQRQRFIAPILLILTIIISFILWRMR